MNLVSHVVTHTYARGEERSHVERTAPLTYIETMENMSHPLHLHHPQNDYLHQFDQQQEPQEPIAVLNLPQQHNSLDASAESFFSMGSSAIPTGVSSYSLESTVGDQESTNQLHHHHLYIQQQQSNQQSVSASNEQLLAYFYQDISSYQQEQQQQESGGVTITDISSYTSGTIMTDHHRHHHQRGDDGQEVLM